MRSPRRLGSTLAAGLAVVAGLAACGGGGRTELETPAGDAGLPPAELAGPSASRYRGEPRALVMLIRGGGWQGPVPKLVQAQEGAARDLRRQGYATLNADYRAGRQGLDDLLVRYDQARRRYPRTPICLYGQSAGAQLALVIAERRPATACVVSQAGPTDLPALASGGGAGAAETHRLATVAFGASRLRELSPVTFAPRIRARVLQIAAANDPLVPVAQARELAPRLRRGELVVLPAGDAPFIHSSVDAAAFRRSLERVNDLLGSAAAP